MVEGSKSLIEVKKGQRLSLVVASGGALVAGLGGRLVDLSYVAEKDGLVRAYGFDSEEGREVFWHSTAHIMAQAVKNLFPGAKLAIGPSISEGFYYDFDVEKPFTPDDLKRIETEMIKIIQAGMRFERKVLSKKQAVDLFVRQGESYKVELLSEIEDEAVTVYENGDFVDLCRGPHITCTGKVGAFKLLAVAGAYWRGIESNRMLSRIYGISFPTKAELDDYMAKLEEAKKRDHRRLGVELDLFNMYEEAGAGLVFWLPKGTILKKAVEDYWYKMHAAEGYLFLSSPHIARGRLWHISGHYDYYFENMYTMAIEKEEYVLKPMNCPGHILIFKSKVRSYRELPMKLAELGTVYRNERSGVLHGLLRVRGFTIDDAHIFCTPEQINDEIVKVIDLAQRILKKFGFERYRLELSVWDPKDKAKYLGSDEEWSQAEAGLVYALNKLGLPYRRMEGEAAFYGPKVDIKILDALGRPWQATTVQFDFNAPRRFDIRYMDKDGSHRQVVIIHRAILGSVERFIGTLIEHYGGAFPLWLAPVQVAVLPITDKEIPYAEICLQELLRGGLRAELNLKSEKIGHKIREAEVQKVPYMLVIGEREVNSSEVSVRRQKKGDLGRFKLADFLNTIQAELDA